MSRRLINQLRAEGRLPPTGTVTWDMVRAAQALPREIPVPISAEPVTAAVWPANSDKMCPWCRRTFARDMNRAWHMKGCSERPRGPEAVT